MDTRFIQVGNRVFAVEQIVAVRKLPPPTELVQLWTANDTDPWEFGGEEAVALWKWAQVPFRTLNLLAEPLSQSLSK